MHILVYMYVFIYRKLESFFFILMQFTYMKKTGRHGFNWGSGAAGARSNHFPERLCLASREAGGCSMDVNSFIFVMFGKKTWTVWTLMLL